MYVGISRISLVLFLSFFLSHYYIDLYQPVISLFLYLLYFSFYFPTLFFFLSIQDNRNSNA